MPEEVRTALPPEFTVYKRVDPAAHPCGWSFDRVGEISVEEPSALPVGGQA